MGTHPIFESDFDCLTEMDLSGVGDFLGQNRNIVSTITSSFFFFTGWWIAIDSAVRCNISEFPELKYLDAYHTCGVFATLSFLLINSVSNSRLDDDLYDGGLCSGCGAKVWLFIGFMCSFGSVIASLWILFGAYVTNGPDIPDGSDFTLGELRDAKFQSQKLQEKILRWIWEGESWSVFAENDIQITKVKLLPNFSTLRIHWSATGVQYTD